MSGLAAVGFHTAMIGMSFILLMSNAAPFISVHEAALGSIAVGTVLGSWVVFLVACVTGHLDGISIGLALVILGILTADHFVPAWQHFRREVFQPADRVAAAAKSRKGEAGPGNALNDGITRPAAALMWAFLLVIGTVLWPLWSSRFLPEYADGSVRSGGSCWADLPIHMHMMQSFLVGRNQDISFFGLHSPIFAGRPMSYPFIPDFHSAILVKLGFSMRWAMLLPGFLMFISCMGLAFCLAFRVSRSSSASLVGGIMVILSGGVGGINWLSKDRNDAMNHDPMQDDPTPGRGNGSVFWFAFLPHVLMPQRAANYGYPVALLAVILIWLGIKSQSTLKLPTRRRLLLVCAILCGLLPLVHAHSFVCMAVIIGVLFVLDFHAFGAEPMQITAWLPAGMACLLLFLPQYMLIKKMEEDDTGKHTIEGAVIFHGHDKGDVAWALGKVGLSFAASYIPAFWKDFLTFAFRSTTFTTFLYMAGVASFVPFALLTARSALVYARTGDVPGSFSDPRLRQVLLLEAGGRSKKNDEDRIARGDDMFGDEAVYAPKTVHVNRIRSKICADAPVEMIRLDDALAAADMVGQSRRVAGAKLAIASVVLMFVGLLIKFQPWDKDNTKLHLLWLLISSGYLGGAVMWPVDTAFAPQLEALAAAVTAALDRMIGDAASTASGRDSHGDVQEKADTADPTKDGDADSNDDAVAGGKGSDKQEGLRSRGAGGKDSSKDDAGKGSHHDATESKNGSKPGKAAEMKKPAAASSAPGLATRGASLLLGAVTLSLAAVSCISGWMSIEREFRMDHELYGNEEKDMAKYLIEHVSPKAVIVHANNHRALSGMLAGKPSLVAYDGWMWSHGYNYGERHNDRNIIVDHLVKDSDPQNYDRMRRWGVRYVLAENPYVWPTKRKNPQVFLSGKLKRVHTSGRFQLFEVLGYGFEPT